MHIRHLILLPDGDQLTAGEAVTAELQAEASCLLISIETGKAKADVFLWRDGEGRVWGRITDSVRGQKGEVGQEVNLFPGLEPVNSGPTPAEAKPDPVPPSFEESEPEEEIAPAGVACGEGVGPEVEEIPF